MSSDYELFKGKKLSDLFEDIYRNQKNKKQRISEIINEIRQKVKTANDMAALYPIISDLVDASVKNDDSLIRMASVAQRLINSENKSEGDDGFLTADEKKELLEMAKKDAEKVSKKLDAAVDDIDLNIDDISKRLDQINGPKDK